jgi:hypothetical protein
MKQESQSKNLGKDPLQTAILPEPYRPVEWKCQCGASLWAAWLPSSCPICRILELPLDNRVQTRFNSIQYE